MLLGQAQNFVDTNGVRLLAGDFGRMSGYLAAHMFNTIRTAYGGAGGRTKWIGNLATHSGAPSVTVNNFTGMDAYI